MREPQECADTGVIPGALRIPRGMLEVKIEHIITPEEQEKKGVDIVLYCAGGMRSAMAVESLIRMGYDAQRLESLHGGITAWIGKKLPLEPGRLLQK